MVKDLLHKKKSIQVIFNILFYRVGVLWGFVYRGARDFPVLQPNLPFYVYKVIFPIFAARNLKKAAYGQGIGRHSEAEVIEMGIKDMRALSHFLGTVFFLKYSVKFNSQFLCQ